MSDFVTVVDPAGNKHQATPANANDLVYHAGWSFANGGQVSAIAVAAAQSISNPEFLDVVSPEGKTERHAAANAQDLINAGWRRADEVKTPTSANISDDTVELPPAHMPDLVAFASLHELDIDENLDAEALRTSLIQQFEAKKAPKPAATPSDDLPAEGAKRDVLKAFADKHDLKIVLAPGTSNAKLREDLIAQFQAKAAGAA